MANFGVTPISQPVTAINVGNFLVGISKVIIDGSWVGMVKSGTGATFSPNATVKDIATGYYPGTRLGRLNLGMSPEVKVNAVEGSLANLRMFMDFRGSVANSRLSIGLQNAVATVHSAQIYSTGPQQRIRRLSLYRVGIRVDGDINWAHPEDETEFPLILEVYPNMQLAEGDWFGEVIDENPS